MCTESKSKPAELRTRRGGFESESAEVGRTQEGTGVSKPIGRLVREFSKPEAPSTIAGHAFTSVPSANLGLGIFV